ncbi:MAG: ABC transporter ATP-binding protein [Nitrospinota bacterium]|nr:ABC transporter ATP-binding protein [Nitrospinota bacterium]
MLKVEKINTFYGLSHILHDLSLSVNEGEAVALLGRNGAGKSTTLKTVMGLIQPESGKILMEDKDITFSETHTVSEKGISWVPEDRQVFTNLTVLENLKISRIPIDGGKDIDTHLDWIFSLFPRLKERINNKGNQLSGGEQQMLTIARGLGSEPRLMLIDEPTEGLMPAYVETIGNVLEEIKNKGIAIILVEQNFKMALNITARAYLIEKGIIRWEGKSKELLANEETRMRYLGV